MGWSFAHKVFHHTEDSKEKEKYEEYYSGDKAVDLVDKTIDIVNEWIAEEAYTYGRDYYLK